MSVRRLWIAPLTAFMATHALLAQQAAPVFKWPDGKQAALSLSFDDARVSQIEGAAVLDRHGVKATFYVVPPTMEKRLDGWKKVAASGHEIANHSLNHRCSGNFPFSRSKALEEYTVEEMRRELAEANAQIVKLLGVPPPESFAYPCGQTFVGRGVNTRSYVPVAAELFVTARGWLDEAPNDPSYVDFAQITGMESDGKDFADIRPIIESARKTGFWVVLAGHDMGASGRQVTRLAMLEQLSAYATDPANGVWIAPVGTVARYVRAQRDAVR
jgi:peptidoglycan/xylan/chitin deacetylase (PgdA/CDA1 family)